MNNKGFTLIELLVNIVLIALIMAMILPSALRENRKNQKRIYAEYENMMVEYARINELNTLDLIDLMDLEELEKVKNECIGYVTIDHEIEPNQYKAYISCPPSYETEGFDSTKAIKRYNGGNGGNGSDGPTAQVIFANTNNITDPDLYLQIYNNNQELYYYTPRIGEEIPYKITLYAGDEQGSGDTVHMIYTGNKEINCYVSDEDSNDGHSEDVKCKVYYSTDEHKFIGIYARDAVPSKGWLTVYAIDSDAYDFLVSFRYEVVKKVPSITVSNEYFITDSHDKISFSVTTDKGLSLSVNNNKCSVVYQNNGYNDVLCQGLPRGNNTLTFSTAENREYKAGSVTKTFNLPYENGFINITASDDNVPCNGTKTYTISHHGGTLSCTTSNPSVATCSVNGNYVTVNGISSGYFKLTVTSSQTSTYNSASKETDQYVDSCATWHYKINLPLLCSNMCSSLCSESSSNTWSCTSSDATPPSGVSQNTGSRCWCYY